MYYLAVYLQADVHLYSNMENKLLNILTLYLLKAKILFQIYQVCLPYTKGNNNLALLETIFLQLLSSLVVHNICCNFR